MNKEYQVYEKLGYLETTLILKCSYKEIEYYFLKYYDQLPNLEVILIDKPEIKVKLEKAFIQKNQLQEISNSIDV